MKLHNTLTKTKQPLQPLKPGHISLYTCGPTVYHYAHIGNLRNVVFNDTLRRALEAHGYHVHHVMNITDVGHLVGDADEGQDKLEKGAQREGKTVQEVAEHYTKAFHQHSRALNVLEPTQTIKATDTIESQVELVQVLLEKGFAYQTEQAIYFDITKLDDYGKLSGQSLSEKEVGARNEVVTDANKHHPQDFALWFFTVGHFAHHEMRWPTPWGEGFPGWHLECSAIIHKTLGETIDIHTGGVDLIGTHHTNEIAQSEAAFEKPLANVWMHNEFLLINGFKMSKSVENAYTLSAITDKGFNPIALRMLYLQSHYRSQQNITWEALEAAANYLGRLQAWADGQFQEGAGTLSDDSFSKVWHQLLDDIADDLNTPAMLVTLSKLLDQFESDLLMPTVEQVEKVESLLGLRLNERQDLTAEQRAVIAEREGARQAKDYETSDKARRALHNQGVEVDDTFQGPRWYRR